MKIRKRLLSLASGILLGALSCQQASAAGDPPNLGGVNVVVGRRDALGQRNAQVVLEVYKKMINQKQPKNVGQYLEPSYIQHNPTIETGAEALIKAFAYMEAQHPRAHVVVHQVIAVGNFVYAHVNFVNLFSDDPNDRGLAGVDIYRFDNNGRIAEHWDVLQPIPDPKNAANPNGMF